MQKIEDGSNSHDRASEYLFLTNVQVSHYG